MHEIGRVRREVMMRRWISLLAVLALAVAACGGAGSADSDSPGSGGETDGTGSSPDDSGPPSDEADSLAAFFGWDQEFNESDWADQEARVQEAIRVCMAEEGFEYQPMIYSQGVSSPVDDWDEEEWVRTQGFGITTHFGNAEEFQGEAEEWTDPNEEMLNSMSEGEQQAWYAALYGTEEEQMEGSYTEVDSETGDEYQVMEGYGAGCQGKASEAEYGSQSGGDLWEELGPDMEAMYARVSSDPRMIELQQEWSTCMAEAGYEYTSPDAMHENIYDDFYQRFEEIVGPNGGYADPFEGWNEDEINAFFEEKSQEEIDAFFREEESKARQDVDMEALGVLQQEEIDVAVADFECRGDYWEVYQEVSMDYEADFIAQNREKLEQIRDGQGG